MKFSDVNRRTAAVAVIAAGVLTAASLNAGAASAATAADGVGIMGNAPSCVKVWVTRGTGTQTGHAKNECGRRLNLKIIWALGSDSSCTSVANGYTLTSKVPIQPRRFDGASTC